MVFFSSFLAWSVFNANPGYRNTFNSISSLIIIFAIDIAMSITYVSVSPLSYLNQNQQLTWHSSHLSPFRCATRYQSTTKQCLPAS